MGTFECKGSCSRSWSSVRAQMTFELKEQKLVKFWAQKCQKCEQPARPSFINIELEEMVQFGIER